MERFETIARRLSKSELPLSSAIYSLKQIEELSAYDMEDLEQLHLLGFPLVKTNENYVTLKTRITPFSEQIFCIVDIEASANDVKNGQIIELGAIKLKNKQIIDKFESLAHAKEVPSAIEELTGIDKKQLENAPSVASVLEKFRLFIKDAVFVAHNANFDFNFISDSFIQCGFGPMLNRKLCTIDLAKKTIKAQRYGLEYLREELNINEGEHHRAYSDANSAMEIFFKSLENIPNDVITTEELLYFAKPNEKKRKKKKIKKSKFPTKNPPNNKQ